MAQQNGHAHDRRRHRAVHLPERQRSPAGLARLETAAVQTALNGNSRCRTRNSALFADGWGMAEGGCSGVLCVEGKKVVNE